MFPSNATLGFERLLDNVLKVQDVMSGDHYPPHSVVKTGQDSFEVTMAVAGFSENDVIDMNRRMTGHDQSLNNPFSADNDDEWINSLVDDKESHESKFIYKQELFRRKEMLESALRDLDDRERYIITHRRLVDDPLTLDQLSKSFGISRERVRQVEAKAFEKLKKFVKNVDYRSKNFS